MFTLNLNVAFVIFSGNQTRSLDYTISLNFQLFLIGIILHTPYKE